METAVRQPSRKATMKTSPSLQSNPIYMSVFPGMTELQDALFLQPSFAATSDCLKSAASQVCQQKCSLRMASWNMSVVGGEGFWSCFSPCHFVVPSCCSVWRYDYFFQTFLLQVWRKWTGQPCARWKAAYWEFQVGQGYLSLYNLWPNVYFICIYSIPLQHNSTWIRISHVFLLNWILSQHPPPYPSYFKVRGVECGPGHGVSTLFGRHSFKVALLWITFLLPSFVPWQSLVCNRFVVSKMGCEAMNICLGVVVAWFINCILIG